MGKPRRRKPLKMSRKCCCFEEAEVSSKEWEFIRMSQQEEDLISRMHKLVGDRWMMMMMMMMMMVRWTLIASRIPGRKAEEIERFWLMRYGQEFAGRRRQLMLLNNPS
ncbi:MYB-like transcription factor ETC3 isoform X2 [Diospyros lotus]|uniref:MYB-like transcription factor ETC3 isoform X2 n=1 Tax=Diospyros lotus TaxID=55363 RepID=UPI0022504E0F|nr:MYB-like transcription factor ETC3 isoform X2 [Diospyros lotus]